MRTHDIQSALHGISRRLKGSSGVLGGAREVVFEAGGGGRMDFKQPPPCQLLRCSCCAK